MDHSALRGLKISIAILALQLGTAVTASAFATNPSFESGDLTGWTTVGNVAIDGSWRGISPTDGGSQVILRTSGSAVAPSIAETALGLPSNTIQILFDNDLSGISFGSGPVEGSALQQSFFADAGDLLTVDWNFVTRETPPDTSSTDFLWQHLVLPDGTDIGGVLAHAAQPASDFSNAGSPSFQQTGPQTFTFTLPQSGTYTFSVGVQDVQETNHDSFGLFDNFFIVKAPEPGTAAQISLGLLGLAWLGKRRNA
jgi:hypothetical protein